MGLFSRMRRLWVGFWGQLIGRQEAQNATLVAQGALEQHKKNLTRVRDALTNLIFQKKKLQDQLFDVEGEVAELKQDVRQAAAEDRDELACNLIARLESGEEEARFLQAQVETLETDIKMARETESQLQREIVQCERLIGSLSSRYQAIKVRRELQTELQSVTSAVRNSSGRSAKPLADQIRRLEAEMESMQLRRQDWEKEWESMREKRASSRHQEVLRRIKENLRSDVHVLPARVAAETVG